MGHLVYIIYKEAVPKWEIAELPHPVGNKYMSTFPQKEEWLEKEPILGSYVGQFLYGLFRKGKDFGGPSLTVDTFIVEAVEGK